MPHDHRNQTNQNNRKNRTRTNANSLTRAIGSPYPEYSKFKRDSHPILRRQHRPRHAGGFFMPVDYVSRGFFVPGIRGLQDGVSRNKRVVSVRTMRVPGNFCQFSKLTYGVTAMTAQTTAKLRLPFPLSGDPATRINFQQTKNSKVASVDGYHVGTIYPGNCISTRNNETFVDVAFPRVTYAADGKRTTGIMLDQVTLNSEKEAIAFLTALVAGDMQEVQS